MVQGRTEGNNPGEHRCPPRAIPVNAAAIPPCLRALNRWVNWRWHLTDKGKWTKPPVDPKTGRAARTSDPSTWGTFEAALARIGQDALPGIGLVIVPDDELVAVDLDGCCDPADGAIDAEARVIVEELASHAEFSPTGGGLRVLLRAAGLILPGGNGKVKRPAPWPSLCPGKQPAVEVFSTTGFVTITGRLIPGSVLGIEDRRKEVEALLSRLGGGPVARPLALTGRTGGTGMDHRQWNRARPWEQDDATLVDHALATSARFSAVWNNDDTAFDGDASRGDMALLSSLWRRCDGDRRRVEMLARRSPRFREKWNSPRGGGTYLSYTLDKVAANPPAPWEARSRGGRSPISSAPTGGDAGPGDPVPEGPADPHRLARLYLSMQTYADARTLVHWRGEWLRWECGAYRTVGDGEIRAELTRAVKAEFDRLAPLARAQWEAEGEKGRPPVAITVTSSLITNVEQALRSLILLPERVEPPGWLAGNEPFPARDALVLRNGVLDLSNPSSPLLPPTPALFSRVALDYDFTPSLPPPGAWLGFLSQLWPDDAQPIDLVQEWFGYLLSGATDQQKILCLHGPRRSGKGTIGRVMMAVVGQANVCSPTLGSLAGPFGLQPLLGKSVAFVSDARLSRRTDSAVVLERLLAISGEDPHTVDRKHLTSVTGRLAVRFVLASNELPRLDDTSGALAGRLLILRLTPSFYGNEDPGLSDRLIAERGAILLWAMEGLSRLRNRGRFVQPAASMPLVRQMEEQSSPVGMFLADECELGEGLTVFRDDLFRAWADWCGRRSIKPGSETTFGRDLHTAVPTIGHSQPVRGGERARAYVGLRLRPDRPRGGGLAARAASSFRGETGG